MHDRATLRAEWVLIAMGGRLVYVQVRWVGLCRDSSLDRLLSVLDMDTQSVTDIHRYDLLMVRTRAMLSLC